MKLSLYLPIMLCLVLLTGNGVFGATQIEQVPSATGGFIANGDSVNSPPPGGAHPAIALGRLTAGEKPQPWIAFANGNEVRVSRFDGANWQQQGAALNLQMSNAATSPAIIFAGTNNTTPWATFAENIGSIGQILVSHFDGSAWQRAGSGSPSLNRSASQDAAHPRLASGAITQGGEPLPWIAWDEASTSGRRVFVSTIAGNTIQPIGAAINYAAGRNSVEPDLALAGTTPWVVWREDGGSETNKIFAAQAIADANAPGGLSWSVVGQQANCTSAATCALNLNANANAGSPRVAAGMLSDETTPAPWVVFTQQSSAGVDQVYVARFDAGRFRFVSGSLNVDSTQAASSPTIFFVGNVPHIAWTEERNGLKRIFVRHLASAAPGQERWDLNTENDGLTRSFGSTNDPAIGSDGNTPFLAWSEGSAGNIFSARRFPDGPAWGRNYPPFIRIISGTQRLALNSVADDVIGGPVEITSSCDHAHGWDAISEIQFKLSNDSETIFLGRYVAATNQVLVMNPNNPDGPPLGSGTPGAGIDIETSNVILHVSQMHIANFGANAAALDIGWVLSFKTPTRFKQYVQSLNIVYAEPTTSSMQGTIEQLSTGFFRTGSVAVGNQVWLPVVVKR